MKSYRLPEVFSLASLGKTILVVIILTCLASCTLHFKATDLEVDADRQRVQTNDTYELEKVAFFHGGID